MYVFLFIRMYVYEHQAFSADPISPEVYVLLTPMPSQPSPSLYDFDILFVEALEPTSLSTFQE